MSKAVETKQQVEVMRSRCNHLEQQIAKLKAEDKALYKNTLT